MCIRDSNYDTLHTRMREEAFLNAGLRITIADERAASADKPEEERYHSMHYKGGIREFVEYLNRTKTPLHDEMCIRDRCCPLPAENPDG